MKVMSMDEGSDNVGVNRPKVFSDWAIKVTPVSREEVFDAVQGVRVSPRVLALDWEGQPMLVGGKGGDAGDGGCSGCGCACDGCDGSSGCGDGSAAS